MVKFYLNSYFYSEVKGSEYESDESLEDEYAPEEDEAAADEVYFFFYNNDKEYKFSGFIFSFVWVPKYLVDR